MTSARTGFLARFTAWVRAQPRNSIGWVLAVSATVAFSMAPPLVRFAILDGFDPTTLLLLRMMIAATLLGVTLAALDWHKLQMSRRGIGSSALVGLSTILALSPPIVLSLLALRGERLTRRHLVRLGLAMVGVYLLIGPTGEVNWLGAGLALLATLLFSLQMALTQWTLVSYPTRTVTFYVTLSMTVYVAAWWLVRGAPWSAPSVSGWIVVMLLAVVSTYFARLTFFAAMGRIGGAQVSLLGPLETLLSVVWSILFLHERLAPAQFVGGALILISALLAVQRLGRINLRLPRR